jgi:CRISPR system Cascade subunit CasE
MADLYMVRLRLDARRLMELSVRRGLFKPELDMGYLLHSQLGELFGELAPRPFCMPSQLQPESRGATDAGVVVLGYSAQPGEALRARAQRLASPEHWEALLDQRVDSKLLPADWKSDETVGFEVRACPVVRSGRSLPGKKKLGDEVELDAFLHAKLIADPDEGKILSRDGVYIGWLEKQLERLGGASPSQVEVVSHVRERVFRRTQGAERKTQPMERPAVVFRGRLTVTEPAAFQALLARGVGRHRGFGFGMLLLK